MSDSNQLTRLLEVQRLLVSAIQDTGRAYTGATCTILTESIAVLLATIYALTGHISLGKMAWVFTIAGACFTLALLELLRRASLNCSTVLENRLRRLSEVRLELRKIAPLESDESDYNGLKVDNSLFSHQQATTFAWVSKSCGIYIWLWSLAAAIALYSYFTKLPSGSP